MDDKKSTEKWIIKFTENISNFNLNLFLNNSGSAKDISEILEKQKNSIKQMKGKVIDKDEIISYNNLEQVEWSFLLENSKKVNLPNLILVDKIIFSEKLEELSINKNLEVRDNIIFWDTEYKSLNDFLDNNPELKINN